MAAVKDAYGNKRGVLYDKLQEVTNRYSFRSLSAGRVRLSSFVVYTHSMFVLIGTVADLQYYWKTLETPPFQ